MAAILLLAILFRSVSEKRHKEHMGGIMRYSYERAYKVSSMRAYHVVLNATDSSTALMFALLMDKFRVSDSVVFESEIVSAEICGSIGD